MWYTYGHTFSLWCTQTSRRKLPSPSSYVVSEVMFSLWIPQLPNLERPWPECLIVPSLHGCQELKMILHPLSLILWASVTYRQLDSENTQWKILESMNSYVFICMLFLSSVMKSQASNLEFTALSNINAPPAHWSLWPQVAVPVVWWTIRTQQCLRSDKPILFSNSPPDPRCS